jgi:hypothetical protein
MKWILLEVISNVPLLGSCSLDETIAYLVWFSFIILLSLVKLKSGYGL